MYCSPAWSGRVTAQLLNETVSTRFSPKLTNSLSMQTFPKQSWTDSNLLTTPSLDELLYYPRDAMLARVFATATCPDICPSVRPSGRLPHAGIVPSRAKAGSWNVHHLKVPSFKFLTRYESSKNSQAVTPKERAKWGWVGVFRRF